MRHASRIVALTLVAAVATRTPLLACPICFQVEQGPVTDGVHAAVLVLVAVTAGVLAGFGTFVRRFVHRARELEQVAAGGPTDVGRPR